MDGLNEVSPCGTQAVHVTGSSTLHVFADAAGSLNERRFSEKAHLLAPYTSLAWAPYQRAKDGESSSSSSSLAPCTRLAVGSETGIVAVWDVARGEVVHRLGSNASDSSMVASAIAKGAKGNKRPREEDASSAAANTARHSTPVRALAWSADGRKVFSSAADSSTIIAWDAKKGSVSKTYGGKAAATYSALAVSPDAKIIFAASTDVTVIDAASGTNTAVLAGGHSVPIKSIAMPEGDATLLVTIGDERNVCVWDSASPVSQAGASTTPEGVPTMPPAAVLLAPSRPAAVAVARESGRRAAWHVIVVHEDGLTASLYRYRREKKAGDASAGARKPLKPTATLTLDPSAVPSGSARDATRILAARVLPPGSPALPATTAGRSVLRLMVGPAHSPSFYSVPFTTAPSAEGASEGDAEAGGRIVEAGVIVKVAGPKNSKAAASTGAEGAAVTGAAKERKGAAKTTNEHVGTGKAAMAAAGAVKGGEDSEVMDGLDDSEGKKEDSEESDDGEETLGSRLASVITSLRDSGKAAVTAAAAAPAPAPGAAGAANGAAPTLTIASALSSTGSLAAVLAQALHAGDDATLELVLSYSEPTVIASSVARLPPPSVLPLLSRLVAKLQAKPTRGLTLSAWLRPLLSTHAGYLLGLPDLPDRLGALYSLLDSRLAVHKKLLKLSGRLDLVMAQAAAAAAASAAAGGYARAIKKARKVVAQSALDAQAAMARNAASAGSDEDDSDGEGEADSDVDEDEARALLQGGAGGSGRAGRVEDLEGDDDEDEDGDSDDDSDAHLDEGLEAEEGEGGDDEDDEEGDEEDDDEEGDDDGEDEDDE